MDGKKNTGKKKPLDEESDEGFGLRTGPSRAAAPPPKKETKKETARAERPTGKPAKSDTGRAERPAKSDTGKHEKPAKKETGKHAAPKADTGRAARPKGEPVEGRRKGSKAPVLLALLILCGAGAGGAFLLRPEEGRSVASQGGPAPTPILGPGEPKTPTVRVEPIALTQPGAVEPGVSPPEKPLPLAQGPGGLQPLGAPGTIDKNSLEEMAKRSVQHGDVARILEQFADLFRMGADLNPMMGEGDFQERQRREEELIARLRALGPQAAGALQDMILGLDNRAHQIFLSKGLAGIQGPEALGAVQKILGQNKDVAIQTTLVRFLPESPESTALMASAFQGEPNPHLRTMLMRELSAREQGKDGSTSLFRNAATGDADPNVRAEAVSILGRMGDPANAPLMEQIARDEQTPLQIRQRAIVSYAETAGEGSLRYLEDLARNQQAGVPVRASAVLAIGRVGGDGAIRSLETIAATDPDQEIRSRAQRLAASLRARQQADAQGPARVDEAPLRTGPGGAEVGPLQPR